MQAALRQFLTVALFSAGLASCGGDWGPEDDGDGFGDREEPVQTDVARLALHQGTNNGTGATHERQVRFLRDQVSYEDALLNYSSDDSTAQDVDFEDFQLLLIDMGTRSTGGYAIAVSNVYEQEGIVTAELRYTYPEEDCSVSEAETTPYLFLRLETQLPVVLSEEVSYTEC